MFDVRTVLVGTLIVTFIAMLLAAPIGLASAIYLAEYAQPRTRSTVKPILEILAGIPSVVLGFFALTWISPNVVQTIFHGRHGFSLLAAGIGVGILTDPARRIDLRGRDAGRATIAPRGVVWARGPPCHDEPAGRRPGRDLRDRRGHDPRHLAGDRRDDGRRDRGRRAAAARCSR